MLLTSSCSEAVVLSLLLLTCLFAGVLGIMFSGTAGLADCNLPEDGNFRGADLLRTPSPAAWSKSGASCPAGTPPVDDSQVCPGTPVTRVSQLSSSPTPTGHPGIAPLLAKAGQMLGAAPAAAQAPLGLAGNISSRTATGAVGAFVSSRGQGSGQSPYGSQAPGEGSPAEEVLEDQPKKRPRRGGPSTSLPAVAEEPEAEPATAKADAAEDKVQSRTGARVRGRSSKSSCPAVALHDQAEEAEQPKKRARRSGPSTSRPAEEAAAGATAAPEAEAVAINGGGDALGAAAVAPDAVAAEGNSGSLGAELGQHVNWEAVRKFKTFAGRYLPNSQSGAVTWMTRRTLFFSLVTEGNQTTKLQLIFWKYLSEKAAAGMPEECAARRFVKKRSAAEDAE